MRTIHINIPKFKKKKKKEGRRGAQFVKKTRLKKKLRKKIQSLIPKYCN
jgi:hypothetical protein